MKYTIVSKQTVTGEEIDDIVDASIPGLTYWAGEIEVTGDGKWPKGMDFETQALTHGRSLRIYDEEAEKWHTLTLKKFLKALSLHPDFNYENYDMYDAEHLVQVALFGEAIYG